MDRQHPERALLRSDQPDELREGWSLVQASWESTVDRIAALPEATQHERVDGEWSAVETLRHLIFVTDSWFSRTINADPHPYEAFALPPSFIKDGEAMGIDMTARPSFDEVIAARHPRVAMVTTFLASVTTAELDRRCKSNRSPGWPRRVNHTVLRCLHAVLGEEWAHHQYAIRDLAVLERRKPDDETA